jgi:hypothetical protein
VVVGVFFQPIPSFRAEHAGAFWAKIRDVFPHSSQNAPLIRPGKQHDSEDNAPKAESTPEIPAPFQLSA